MDYMAALLKAELPSGGLLLDDMDACIAMTGLPGCVSSRHVLRQLLLDFPIVAHSRPGLAS